MTKELVGIVDPIYAIIRPLYDPALPERCRAVEFALEKVGTKQAPWIAVEALYNVLNNWKRQYGSEIQASMQYLRTSLTPIARLGGQGEVLPAVFGENTSECLVTLRGLRR